MIQKAKKKIDYLLGFVGLLIAFPLIVIVCGIMFWATLIADFWGLYINKVKIAREVK